MTNKANKPRTLIIGLDGATFDLIRPWAKAGHLPVLARLMAEGAHGTLDAWPNLGSPAAWTSIVTGYNPGQHGVFDFGNTDLQGSQPWRPTTALDRRKAPFWRRLSDAGQAAGVINVPISYPADKIYGFMLAGMDSPSVHSPGFCHPPGLYDELTQAGIDYAIDVVKLVAGGMHDPHRLPEVARAAVEARGRAVVHLMEHHPWDALMAVFVETDRMQHYFWPAATLPGDSPDWTPLRDLYSLLDHWLGEIVSRLDDQTTVVVLSDHGFGRIQRRRFNTNAILRQLGYAKLRGSQARWQSRLLASLLTYGRRYIPIAWHERLARTLPRMRARAVEAQIAGGLDWAHTRAFATKATSRVTVNLRGRQPAGIVALEEYDALCAEIRDSLLGLIEADTGRPLATTVARCDEMFRGPYRDRGGDLVIRWRPDIGDGPIVYHPRGGEPAPIETGQPKQHSRAWAGTHRPEGIFIAWGPHVKRGVAIDPVRQYDIAATVLYLQGLALPSDMDGRALTEIFTDGWLRDHPVGQSAPDGDDQAQAGPELDEQETAQIEARLRDLGYLE